MPRSRAVLALPSILLLVPPLFLTGCRPLPASSAAPRADRVVTARQIARVGARTAWDALHLLGAGVRVPELASRADGDGVAVRGRIPGAVVSRPLVFLDGVRLPDLAALRHLPAPDVARIELLTGPEASTRFGTNAGRGVIHVRTRGAGGGG